MMDLAVSNNLDTRLRDELKRTLRYMFANKEQIIADLEVVKIVARWLGEAKENEREIPSIITNEAIKWLLDIISPHISKLLIERINVETEVNAHTARISQIEISFDLKPYIEYVMKVNSIESKKARITFSVSLSGKLENVQFPFSIGRRFVTIEKLDGCLSISIIKIAVYAQSIPAVNPLIKPIVLCNKEAFRIEKLSY